MLELRWAVWDENGEEMKVLQYRSFYFDNDGYKLYTDNGEWYDVEEEKMNW